MAEFGPQSGGQRDRGGGGAANPSRTGQASVPNESGCIFQQRVGSFWRRQLTPERDFPFS
jgi:hypothetical protein